MSGIACLLAAPQAAIDQGTRAVIDPALDAMRRRGSDRRDVARAASVVIGLCRHDWELPEGEPTGIGRRGRIMAAADASLTYRADLRRLVESHGVEVSPSAGSTELILAAYEAFGDDCVRHLEGDFAFVLWDEVRGELHAARAFNGRRTLFYAQADVGLMIASNVSGILANPAVSRELSMATVATVAAGLWLHSHETGYRAVSELPAGHRLIASRSAMRLERFWSPPSEMLKRPGSIDDAAAELHELLVAAVNERLDPTRPTAISLSGGWDSSAVYGAGQVAMRRSPSERRSLRPVSISYPVGDPGRENEIIEEILARFGGATNWVDVDAVRVLLDPRAESAARDEPFAHAYEHWNRELSRGARRLGARVILDGSGGDQLFQVSQIYLADLFRRGRWLEMLAQWRARGGSGLRELYRTAIRPALPTAMTNAIAAMRRTTRPPHYLAHEPAFWFRRGFLARHGVLERERADWPRTVKDNHTLAETQSFLTFPYFTRIARMLTAFGLEEGVEVRSPLLDDRIVRFAVPRPWYERANRGETKVVLRRAMKGVLPDSVIAPRAHRTGVSTAYFVRELLGAGRSHFEAMLDDPLVVSLGMVEPARLRLGVERFLQHGNEDLGIALYHTLQAELWLRARMT